MKNSNYEVDILIDGKPIRKYAHDGKLFVEGRKGSEYSIRIKNNSIKRIMVSTSVDGLCVVSGKQADENSTGYVINGYNSLTIDGFRISDEKVARFIFEQKDKSYAATKENDEIKNVGVIGVNIFSEKEKPIPTEIHHWHQTHYYPQEYYYPYKPIMWGATTTLSNGAFNAYNASSGGTCNSSGLIGNTLNAANLDCGLGFSTNEVTVNCPAVCNYSSNLSGEIKPQSVLRGFDQGTSFGQAKESKVTEVEFEKGELVFQSVIYYASRESLIEMKVPIINEAMVAFPEPFKNSKYATPPKNWNG